MFKADIPFARDDANRFLPWMIALMCGIAALMLCLGLTLGGWAGAERMAADENITVQVPFSGDKQEHKVKQVIAALEKNGIAKGIRVLTNTEVQTLVAPWLGSGIDMKELPAPTVMEVAVISGGARKESTLLAKLSKDLTAIDNAITIDTQEAWAEKFAAFSRTLQGGVYILAICIIISLGGMMIFTSRAAMKLHASTVHLLHSIGADDRYIARQFQNNTMLLALRGAVPGSLCAGLAYALLGAYATRLDAPLLPSLTLTGAHIALLVALPLICAAISFIAVRYSTLAQLRLLP